MSKTVSRERAMDMFNHDLDFFMNDIRGLLSHYRIADLEAYLFFRKPDCPQSYVLKYEATAGDEFAGEIVRLHQHGATPSTEAQPVVRDNATMVAWQKAESQRLNTEAQKCVKCGHDKSNVDTEGRCSFGWAYHANCKDWCGCRCVFPTEAQPDDLEKQAREIVERWQRESEPPPLGINIEKELIEEIAAALRSRPVEQEWLPIESAPKDGRAVHLGFAHMKGFDVIAHWDTGDWALTGEGAHAIRLHGRPKPTHWRPLRDPPAARAQTCSEWGK